MKKTKIDRGTQIWSALEGRRIVLAGLNNEQRGIYAQNLAHIFRQKQINLTVSERIEETVQTDLVLVFAQLGNKGSAEKPAGSLTENGELQLLMEQLQLLAERKPEAVLLITDCQVYGKQFGTEHSLKESELGFISHTAAAEISLQYMRMAEHLACRLAEEEKMHVRTARQNLRTETENLEQVMEAVLRVLLYGEDGEIYNLPQSGKPWEYGEEDDRSPLAPLKIVPDTGKTDDRTSLGR